jgi:hypothetical protein
VKREKGLVNMVSLVEERLPGVSQAPCQTAARPDFRHSGSHSTNDMWEWLPTLGKIR